MTGESRKRIVPTATHWGNFRVETEGEKITAVHNYDDDETPSIIGQSLLDSRDPNYRIAQPMVRKSYLERRHESDPKGRGREPFVAVSWEKALDLAAAELSRVRDQFGNAAIYAGSYGWASAGRFHHTQSQLHRFLKQFGGYTESDRTYSAAAAEVLLPRILGKDIYTLFLHTTPWREVAEHGELVVCFGGVSLKNLQVVMGGPGAHTAPGQLEDCARAGIRFINVSPIRDDTPTSVEAEWVPIRPTTDTALILAICHTLITEEKHDEEFLRRYTVGFERFRDYLFGADGGPEKDAEWAAEITSVSAQKIRELANLMATQRTFIPMGWSLQRAEHGEQPYWAGTALMCLLGQIGLPGAGIGHGVGSLHTIGFMGRRLVPFKWGTLEQGENPTDSVIPVARVTDMLEKPGEPFDYDGRRLTYPDIRLIYWAGGNPFHHHQDLNRLRKAWLKPETVIVNEQVWTATARHADIVFPITTSLERNDLGLNTFDHYVTPMPQAVPPFADARNDFDVFSELAERLGFRDRFTEGRDEMEWVQRIYDISRAEAALHKVEMPDFESFWTGEHFSMEAQFDEQQLLLEAFREDPHKHRLGTPSGKIEIFSEVIDSFNYENCPGHPVWLDKQEWLGAPLAARFPFHLISNQPAARLHSQLDFAGPSKHTKIADREPATLHPDDAAERGIQTGDVIRLYNDRGACLAGADVSDRVRPGVIQLSTGAWYDPVDDGEDAGLDVSGNPNVLTQDVGTSDLAQGPSSHSCLVEVEKYSGPEIKPRCHYPPPIIRDET